jgi:hypothetical protein
LAISARCIFNCFSSLAVVVDATFLDGDDFLLVVVVDVNLILSTAESFLDAIFAVAVVVAAIFDADEDGEGEDFLEDVFIGEMLGVVKEEGAVGVVAAEEAAAAAIAGAATILSLFGAAD